MLTSTLTLQGGYHHYAHITKEETEVYKSSVACSESHSQWAVKSGSEFANICYSHKKNEVL